MRVWSGYRSRRGMPPDDLIKLYAEARVNIRPGIPLLVRQRWDEDHGFGYVVDMLASVPRTTDVFGNPVEVWADGEPVYEQFYVSAPRIGFEIGAKERRELVREMVRLLRDVGARPSIWGDED